MQKHDFKKHIEEMFDYDGKLDSYKKLMDLWDSFDKNISKYKLGTLEIYEIHSIK